MRILYNEDCYIHGIYYGLRVVGLDSTETEHSEVDFMSFINEALEYFVEVEGWSPIYAFQVIMKQNNEAGLAQLKKQSLNNILESPTPDVMMSNIVFFKEKYTDDDVRALVERIGDVLSNYKDKNGISKLKRDLLRIAQKNN